jgi:plastocyanin
VTPAPASEEPRAGQAASEVEVVITDLKYAPAILSVSPGTTVRWVNRDLMDHTVTSRSGLWDSGNIRPGASWSRRFDEPGSYPYLCTPHPFMTGTVVVR